MSHRTQNRNKTLLKESVSGNLSQELNSMYGESKKILNDFDKIWDLNLKLLTTWGAALGGIMLPMKKWIETKYPELTYEQVILVLMGSIIDLYYDNEYFINNIVKKAKREGLLEELKLSIRVAKKLNESLNELLDSMDYYGEDFVDSLSFAFVLPILDDLKSKVTAENVESLARELVSTGVLLTSTSKMKFFLSKLLERA
jgi:hypothetical protein